MRTWLDVMVDRLADAPQEWMASAVPGVLKRIAGEKRAELLGRVQDALAGRLDLLGALADGLYYQSWPGAEQASVQLYLAILEKDSQRESAAHGLARALNYVPEYELAHPLMERTLALTDHDPQLVASWTRRLLKLRRPDEAEELVLLALRDGQPWPFGELSHLSLSDVYERRGQFVAAEQWLDKISVVLPDDPLITVHRASSRGIPDDDLATLCR